MCALIYSFHCRIAALQRCAGSCHQQRESAVRVSVCACPACRAPPLRSLWGTGWAVCVTHGSPAALFHMQLCMYVGATFSVHPTLFLKPLCPQIRSLHLRPYFFPANGFICTIFLFIDPIKMC